MKVATLLYFAGALLTAAGIEPVKKMDYTDSPEPCSTGRPNFTWCLEESVKHFLYELRDAGISNPYFPKIMSIILPELEMMISAWLYSFKVDLTNLKFKIIPKVNISDIHVKIAEDYSSVAINFTYNYSVIKAEANFTVAGQKLLPMEAGGEWWCDYDQIEVKFFIKAKTGVTGKCTYWVIDSLDMDFDVNKTKMDFAITRGHALSKVAMDHFVGANMEGITKQMATELQRKFRHRAMDYVGYVFAAFPYHKWIDHRILDSPQVKSARD